MWSYSPASHEFKCILPRSPYANVYDIIWLGQISETQIAMVCQLQGMALFDFTTDEHRLLFGKCLAIGLTGGAEGSSIQTDSASFLRDGWIWSAGHVGHHWAGNTFSRVSTAKGRKQDLPPLRVNDKEFSPNECFRLISSDQALIGDQRGLWLVTFADEDAKTKSAKP
jgi:hypothetical protein